MGIYEIMPIETRRGKLDSTTQPDPINTNMAAGGMSTNREPDNVEPDLDSVPDRKLLLQILSNQKSSEKKSVERFDRLTKQVNDAKKPLTPIRLKMIRRSLLSKLMTTLH